VAKRQNPGAHQRRASKLDTARKDFISAMKELAEERIPNNPQTALVEEVFPKWRDAGSTPAATSPRFRFRTGTHIDEENKRARRREIIEEWARRFWLLGTNGEPADWIVAYAEELCQEPSGEWRDGPIRLGGLGHPGPGFNQLSLPMKDPEPRPGEAFADFRKRARHALTVYLDHLERTYGPNKAVAPARPKIAGNPSPRSPEHFRWLVLFQCCKWKLSKIHAAYGQAVGNPEDKEFTAIYLAIKRKAELLEISLRRREYSTKTPL
jgi:hypothetical protein